MNVVAVVVCMALMLQSCTVPTTTTTTTTTIVTTTTTQPCIYGFYRIYGEGDCLKKIMYNSTYSGRGRDGCGGFALT